MLVQLPANYPPAIPSKLLALKPQEHHPPLAIPQRAPTEMGSLAVTGKEREGAEIVYGREECRRHCMELLEELGFPRGVLPLKDLQECGGVKETGFVWMKQRGPYEHFFAGTKTRVRYEAVVTAYVEKNSMKKMTGVRSRQMLLWVPITEMSLDDPAGKKIYFKSAVGIGRSFPVSAFLEEEQKKIEGEIGA